MTSVLPSTEQSKIETDASIEEESKGVSENVTNENVEKDAENKEEKKELSKEDELLQQAYRVLAEVDCIHT